MSKALPTFARRLVPYAGLAAYLGISLRSAKQLAADGQIQKVVIGSRVLFDVRDIDAYIDRVKAAS